METFGNYPLERPFDPFSVMLFKALQVVAFLFFLALLAISPEAKDGKVDSKAEFIITMDWPDNHPDDIDTTALLEQWREELFGAEGVLVDHLK